MTMPTPKTKAQEYLERLGAVWSNGDELGLQRLVREIEITLRVATVEDSSCLHLIRGHAHERLGEVVLAEQSYRAGLALDPDGPELLLNLCVTLLRQGRGAEGLEVALRSADAYGEDAWTHVALLGNLACALMAAGRGADARSAFALLKAAADPLNADHLWRLADAAGEVQLFEEAVGAVAAFLAVTRGAPRRFEDLGAAFAFIELTGLEDIRRTPGLDAAIEFAEALLAAPESGRSTSDDFAFAATDKLAILHEMAGLRARADSVTIGGIRS